MNFNRIFGIAVVVVSIMEFVTRGRLGAVGMIVALVIAVIIAWNLPGRRPTLNGADPAPPGSGPGAPVAGDPYAILGVSPGCSDEELSQAYRTLVKQWHPDQLEGMAPELREHANRRLAQINQAFDWIRRARQRR